MIRWFRRRFRANHQEGAIPQPVAPQKKVVPLSITPEETMTIRISPDGGVAVSSEAGVTLNAMNIRVISISNILDLASYGMSTVDGRTMHLLEFRDGGRFEFTYNSLGKIEKCSGTSISTTVEGGDTLIIAQRSP